MNNLDVPSVTFNAQSGTNEKNMKTNKSPFKPLTPVLVIALHNIQHADFTHL